MQREEHERREQFVASLTALGHRERDIALAAYDGDAAAAAIAALARAVHGERPAKAADFLRSEARALDEHGSDRGSNVHLVAAIALQRELLGLAASEEERGAESASLALALLKLGARESGRTRLEEALAILRLVLKEFTPETAPFDWSAAQANLGVALKTLSERVSGSGWLEEAVAAYRAALKEQMRERDPPLWASTQNNLGNALAQMGQRRLDTAPLEKAIEAYRAALEVFTRERLPLDWARTQNNLGSAFLSLGERQPMAGWFEKAIQAYSAALQVLSRKEAPLDWAAAQSNLGFVLLRLCERDIALEPGEPRASDFRAGGGRVRSSKDRSLRRSQNGSDRRCPPFKHLWRSGRGRGRRSIGPGRRTILRMLSSNLAPGRTERPGSRRRSRPMARRCRNTRASRLRPTGR